MNIRSANDNKIKEYISGLCKYITESVNELIRWHDEYSSDNFPLSQNVVGRLSIIITITKTQTRMLRVITRNI